MAKGEEQWATREAAGTTTRRGHELDELQRGQEQPISLETLERVPPSERRGHQVPDPGERPGAVRVSEESEAGDEADTP